MHSADHHRVDGPQARKGKTMNKAIEEKAAREGERAEIAWMRDHGGETERQRAHEMQEQMWKMAHEAFWSQWHREHG